MNAGGISLHAVDVARGVTAAGMRVEIFALAPDRRLIAAGAIGTNGTLDHPVARGEGVLAGAHEAVFHVGDYLAGTEWTGRRFLDRVPFQFVIDRVEEHYHLPFKFTAFGYSLFRGA